MSAGEFDCLIIGAGPAGSSAAEPLAAAGLKVGLLEKHRFPRAKVCAGGLPPKTLALLPDDLGGIARREVRTVRFTHGGSKEFRFRAESTLVTVVERAAFDEWLVRRATAAGAELREGAACVALHSDKDGVAAETTAGLVRARSAIVACGSSGQIALDRRLLGRARIGTALQAEISVGDAGSLADHIGCDFGLTPSQIAWSFPGPESISIGVLTFRRTARGLMGSLRRQLRNLGLSVEPGHVSGGALACWRGQKRFSIPRVLLAGDAAGLVNPLTGAGIRRAIVSGRLAARSILDNLGTSRAPNEGFDAAMARTFARGLSRASMAARIFRTAPGLWYRLGVTSSRGTGLMERLLSGRATYDRIFWELLRGDGRNSGPSSPAL